MTSASSFSQAKHFLFISIFLLIVFILAVAVWYLPVLFKGYSAYIITPNALLGADIYQTGLYSMEGDLNILLSSTLIQEQGHLSASGNKLTSYLYAKVFEITGLPSANSFVLLSVFIHALTLLIFTGVVLYLFNSQTAFIFSLVYIFLPFNWLLPYRLGTYEFSLLFLSLFFLLYFRGIKEKYSYIYLPISGIFLALSCFSREALFLIVPFLLVFLYFKKVKRHLFYIFIPFFIITAIFWLPNIAHNSYLQLFTISAPAENKAADFAVYGHIYPDPYTYHFEKEEYLENIKEQIDNNRMVLMEEIDRIRGLKNMGIADISLFDRIRAGLMLGSRHISRFASLEHIGGPFIFLLILLGVWILRQKNKYLYQFFIYWFFSTIFLLAFVILAGRNHLIDFNWAIASLVALGLLFLAKLINGYFNLKEKKRFLVYAALLLLVLYNFVLASHVAWSRAYDNSENLIVEAYSNEIEKLDISDNDVIAVNLKTNGFYALCYLTDKSMVVFQSNTIKNLLEKKKLDFAFKEFGVKYILGYSDALSQQITEQTKVVNITSNSIEVNIEQVSRNKGFFMNLVR